MEIPFNGQRDVVRANSSLFEIAFVLVRLDHIASLIVNANHSVV